MATSNGNLVLSGLSGKLSTELCVRSRRDGSTVVARPPRRCRRRSPAQQQQQGRFREAVAYAAATKTLPEYVALAAARGVPAYNVAISDFLHPPEILGLGTSAYLGAAGQTIEITAMDDVKVVTVGVTLSLDDGTVFEQGQATVCSWDPCEWTYTTKTHAPSMSVRVQVDVTDLAGHTTTQTTHT